MPIRIPDLRSPLVAVSACANRISLIEHPDIKALVPAKRTREVATVDGGHLILVREQFTNGNVHFHVDIGTAVAWEPPPEPTSSLGELIEMFDHLLGKTLHINFASRFLISAGDMPPVSLIRILSSGGIKINNTTAALAVATLKLTDSVFSQIKWHQVDRGGGAPPDFIVEIAGQLGQMPVTSELLEIAMGRAWEGLRRFVMPSTPVRPAQ